jgi:hypothetical protein
MFEIIHASAMIGKWLEQLPVDLRSLLANSYWYFMAACLALIVWRLSHSKDTLPHGEVKLTWYKPSQWLRRWLSLREQGYAKAPAWFPKYLNMVQTVHNWIGASFVLVLALFCLAMALVWDDLWRALWLGAGLLGLWWAWRMVRTTNADRT